MAQSKIRRSGDPPIGSFIVSVLAFSLVISFLIAIYERFSMSFSWSGLVLIFSYSCFMASITYYIDLPRNIHREVPSTARKRTIQRAIQDGEKGIPWYVAPILWIPVSMLATI